jgi:hypothetical protein
MNRHGHPISTEEEHPMANPAPSLERESLKIGPARPRVRSAADRKADVLYQRRVLSLLSHGLTGFLCFALGIAAAVGFYGSAMAARIVCGGMP